MVFPLQLWNSHDNGTFNLISVPLTVPHTMWRRRQWRPTPGLLPGKSHGRRSLVGCRPWGHWELDTTERLHFHFSLSCTGEGNGNPLWYSCLENPRDEGAWWAAVYGVTQSRTQLKWFSSSSIPYGIPSCVKMKVNWKWQLLSHVWLFAIPWTAHQAPLSMGFPRQEYWSGLILPSPGDLPDPGSNPDLLHCRKILYFPLPGKLNNLISNQKNAS